MALPLKAEVCSTTVMFGRSKEEIQYKGLLELPHEQLGYHGNRHVIEDMCSVPLNLEITTTVTGFALQDPRSAFG